MPRHAALRSLAITVPFALAVIAAKLLKLPTGRPEGMFQGELVNNAWSFVVVRAAESLLPELLAVVGLTALLLHLIGRRLGFPRYTWMLAPLAVYIATFIAGILNGDPRPWYSHLFHVAWLDLREIAALWRRDALLILTMFLTLGWYFSALQPAVWIRVGCRTAVALLFAIVALDLGYFVATRSQLTTEELLYTLASPLDAVTASTDGLSVAASLALTLPIIGLVLATRIARHARLIASGERTAAGALSIGFYVWPAIGLALVAPQAPTNQRLDQFTDTPVLRLATDGVLDPLARFLILRGKLEPTARVPALDVSAVSLVQTVALEPLNVLIVMLESARRDATTVYSPQLPTTPFLAELARESLVIDDMYAVVPRTAAAWIAILAGRYPSSVATIKRWSAVSNSRVLDSSLPRLLRPHGYYSAYFVPTRLDFEDDTAVVAALGFDEVISAERIQADPQRQINAYGWEDRVLLDPISRWLDEHGTPRFLLAVMTNVGHYPYWIPSDFEQQPYPSRSPTHERYLNSMRFIDDYLRALVGELRVRDLIEKTVIVVVGDHGEAFQEHGGYAHSLVIHEEGLRVPMLVRLPRSFGRAGRVGGLRQQIDIVPTIVDALGYRFQGGRMPGRSILGDTVGHEVLFFSTHLDYTFLAMRDGQHKFIYNFGRRPTRVFDLLRDAGELDDRAPDWASADLKRVEIDLLAWRDRVRETYVRHGR